MTRPGLSRGGGGGCYSSYPQLGHCGLVHPVDPCYAPTCGSMLPALLQPVSLQLFPVSCGAPEQAVSSQRDPSSLDVGVVWVHQFEITLVMISHQIGSNFSFETWRNENILLLNNWEFNEPQIGSKKPRY